MSVYSRPSASSASSVASWCSARRWARRVATRRSEIAWARERSVCMKTR
jgi:hypothetical protein